MKKLLLVLGVVAFGFAFTSCNKQCTCTVSYEGVSLPIGIPEGYKIDTKDDCLSVTKIAEIFKQDNVKCDWK